MCDLNVKEAQVGPQRSKDLYVHQIIGRNTFEEDLDDLHDI